MTSAPLLRVEHATKVFGSGRTAVRAVDDVSLETRRGEIRLVTGPSGSGKTTLLSMIGGILRPTSGRIVVDALDLTTIAHRELPRVRRELIGFVFQNFNLLESLSAAENVEIALNIGGMRGRAAHERARALLAEVELEGRADFNARDLSAGERQRVAIARALANRPGLLLADEPTANLDSDHGRAVMTLLRSLAKSRESGVVIVSHDLRLAEIADDVLWLEDGHLRGPTASPRARRSAGAR